MYYSVFYFSSPIDFDYAAELNLLLLVVFTGVHFLSKNKRNQLSIVRAWQYHLCFVLTMHFVKFEFISVLWMFLCVLNVKGKPGKLERQKIC
jgi:hypothetical protein